MDVTVRLLSLTALLALAGTLGCQAPNPSIELLESELRWMEDQLYALDQQLDQTHRQLDSCQRNNASLRQELAVAQRSTPAGARSTRDRAPARAPLPAPGVATPNVEDFDNLQAPSINPGLSPTDDSLNPAAPYDSQPPESLQVPQIMVPQEARGNAPVNVHVARIILNSRLTGGYDFDGQPGDEGLLVVVEPQNNAGQYVPLPGDLTIDVFDPAKTGPEARLARWQFDASETVPYLRQTLLGRGVHLQLPWPNQSPQSSRLRVVASYRAPTGTVLAAERDIRVDIVASQPRRAMANAAALPDQFLPSHPADLQTLQSHDAFAPPDAPVAGPAPMTARPTQPAAQRPAASVARDPARNLVPTWSPYRR